jgi:tetratricopeptide (TPR) repeat protein
MVMGLTAKTEEKTGLIDRYFKFKKQISPLVGLAAGLLATACASVSITSNPKGADIILAVPGQESGKIIGKTPLTSSVSDIASKTNSATLVVTLKKSGYQPHSFVIPNLGSGKLEIAASLQPVGAEDSQEINLAVRYILEAERQIIDKDFKGALKSIEKAKASNPNIAAAYMFEGIVHNLQNDKGKAVEAFTRALALDPTDAEIRALLAEIRGTAPAAKGKK